MTIRLKFILFSLVIVIIPTTIIAFIASQILVKDITFEVKSRIKHDFVSINYNLSNIKISMFKSLKMINKGRSDLPGKTTEERNNLLLGYLDKISKKFKKNRILDIIKISNKDGNILSLQKNNENIEKIKQYGFDKIPDSITTKYYYNDKNLFIFSSAPMMEKKKIIGTIIGGKKISKEFINQLSSQVNGDISFFFKEKYICGNTVPFNLNTNIIKQLIKNGDMADSIIEIDKKQYLLSLYPLISGEYNYLIALKIPYSGILKKGNQIKSIILITGLIITIISLILALIFMNRLNTPLQNLHDATQKIAEGNFNIEIEKITNDEIGNLGVSINSMAKQLKENSAKTEKQVENIKMVMSDMKTIFNGSYDAYFIHDIDGTMIDVNEKMLKMYGIDRNQALKLSIINDYSSPENSFDLLKETWKKVAEGESQSFEWIAKRIDTETPFPVEVHLNKISYNKKNAILATVRDISKRKEMEKTLIENEEKYRSIYFKSREAFTILGLDGYFISANPSAIKLYGCINEAQFSKRTPIDLSPEFQPDGSLSSIKAREMIKKAVKEGSHFFNWKHKKENGKEFYATVLLTKMQLNNTTVLQATIRDITEQKKTEEQLLQAQKMETVGTLAGGLAHDFNNVLAGIIGTLSLIKNRLQRDGAIKTDKLENYLDIMQEAGDQASILVKQLLTLSRKQDLYFTPVDLNSTIKHVIEICKSSFDKSIILNPIYLNSTATVNADSTQLEQVLLNICVNSAHAMTIMKKENEKWGGKLTVSIESIEADKYFCNTFPESRTGKYWLLSVKDNGIGMDKKTLDRMFNPFFSTKDKGAGTGLGLSMVYNIIKQHSGFVDVYSGIGIGSTFNIYLPISEQKLEIEKDKKKKIITPIGEGLILVVDDEKLLRKVVKDILEDCGYSVILAENGKIGVDLFRKRYKEIKAVILDMSMPEMSGEEAFIKMKEIDPDVRVLLASGFKQDDRVKKIISLGVNGFIQKPYTFDKLLKKLGETII